MNVFDYDGVITLGLAPTVGDVVVTGRAVDEASVVNHHLHMMLGDSAFKIPVYFNPMSKNLGRTRHDSARHKVNVIKMLAEYNEIVHVFEDDEIQFDILKKELTGPFGIRIVKIDCPWVEK